MTKNDNGIPPKKICFVTSNTYEILTGKEVKRIVGPDVHQVLLAKEIIKHNLKVSIITQAEGGEPVEYIDGVEIIKINKDKYRFKILNIIIKIVGIWKGMRKANANIYFHAGGMSGVVSPLCMLMGKKYIYEIASDALTNREVITEKNKEYNQSIISLGSIGNLIDIKLADAIIVQNEFQKKMLKKNFGRGGFLIKMSFPLSERGRTKKANPPVVLWVGSMADVKQPELFLKLAKAIPEYTFQMIGGHNSKNQDVYDRIRTSSQKINNFEYLGVIPFYKINEYFNRASILVNTSMFEGFPNVFIQAWMNYVPVVSLNVDPDGIISKYKLGFHSSKFDKMIQDVQTLIKDEQLLQQMSNNGRYYVENNHDINCVVEKYLEVFRSL